MSRLRANVDSASAARPWRAYAMPRALSASRFGSVTTACFNNSIAAAV